MDGILELLPTPWTQALFKPQFVGFRVVSWDVQNRIYYSKPPDRPLLLRYVGVAGEARGGERFSPFLLPFPQPALQAEVSKLVIKMPQVHPSLSSFIVCAALTTRA